MVLTVKLNGCLGRQRKIDMEKAQHGNCQAHCQRQHEAQCNVHFLICVGKKWFHPRQRKSVIGYLEVVPVGSELFAVFGGGHQYEGRVGQGCPVQHGDTSKDQKIDKIAVVEVSHGWQRKEEREVLAQRAGIEECIAR